MIVWRKDPSERLKFFRLKTVTYGTKSAPYLATKCLEYLASKEMQKYPIGSSALKNDFYVDDCITGADTIPEALQIHKKLNHILLSSGLKLRKWCANSNHLLQGLDKEDIIPTVQFEDAAYEDCSIKTLGITWNPTIDKLCGKTQTVTTDKRRDVVSEIFKIFDPLGLFSPIVIKAKIFMQGLTKEKFECNEELPTQLQSEWKQFREDIKILSDIKIFRHVFDGKIPVSKEIHTFVDALENAYAVAIYLRVTVQLLCAKSRLAPVNTITFPRLELKATVLGAQLTATIKEQLSLQRTATYCVVLDK